MTSSADVVADSALIKDDGLMSEEAERDDWGVLSIEEGS